MAADPLAAFSRTTREWFELSFKEPTPVQAGAWGAIASGDDVLVVGPTGSGKTLAGFLWSIDRLAREPVDDPDRRLRVLYVSPLKALAVDIERNLRAPLTGIRATAARLGLTVPEIRADIRTGDTPQDQRRRFATAPPDILITTPESLYLLLTSRARDALRSVDVVIIDEIHAVAHNKRGAHLALSLERLDHLVGSRVQRLGLSATVRPVEEVARFLGGTRTATIVDPGSDKRFDLKVVVPVEDMGELGSTTDEIVSGSAAGAEARSSIWPHVEERVLELIRDHKSTIVFVNSRRLAERLCGRLNERAEEEVARAHHGSVSKEQRSLIEEDLKAGRLPAVVATSSLELGIDMSAVDLVVQVEAPDSVASGLQRIGRAGHQVGEVSRGVIFPKYRGDLLECAVVVERMKAADIESISYPRNALDVLAQQIVAMVAMDDWKVDDLERVVTRAAPFSDLPRSAFDATLDMLSGRYPSHEFATLRPRVNWDRTTGTLSARPGIQSLAVTSGGTIPDRGLFGVFLVGEKQGRVGELDEEMVYESRVGETFTLGASTWLIEEITPDRVMVSPAPGQPGKMPFWHGDAPGRPIELGRALGAFVRELDSLDADGRMGRLRATGLDELAAANLIAYLDEQRDATRALPDDRTIVVERFRDELGDWRICILSPFGARVHAPWSQAIEARLQQHLGIAAQSIYTDDGIVIRLPEAEEPPETSLLFFDPDEIEDVVVDQTTGSALFASRFRECAVRSLLLPRRRPGSRTPLWQQRQKSALLLQVASRYESFPIVLEAMRECLQDVFDLPALVELMSSVRSRRVRVVETETALPSPFASSLQFTYVSAFMYEGDSPLAERRAQALSLDRSLLAEIMGREELRELIDESALARLELELQSLSDARKARTVDDVHDMLRRLGDLRLDEVAARHVAPSRAAADLQNLATSRRAIEVRVAGDERWIAIEDAARYRDALGTPLPVGIPTAFLEAVADPTADLIGRYAATHGPFVPDNVAARLGLGVAVVEQALQRLELDGRVVNGEFRPSGTQTEWIDVEVLRALRRRSLAAFRKEIEAVDPEVLARFELAWQAVTTRVTTRESTLEDVYEVVEQLQGLPVPASALERQVLAARLPGYSPGLLDQLCASGEVVWCGAGPLGSHDGWVVLALAEQASLLLPEPAAEPLGSTAERVRETLAESGASFFRQIAEATGSTDDVELLLALWELVWAGVATNDTLAPLRALGGTRGRGRTARPRRPNFPMRFGPPAGGGRWSLLASPVAERTRRLHAVANQLLARYGVVTRGAVAAERVSGGFAALYPVLKAMEESGHCRRGYFVEGLGGAQFALAGAVDRMRALGASPSSERAAVVLAATDPANPYGATLPWPERDDDVRHKPARKAGAAVVLVEGALVVYVEKGGKTLLSFTEDSDVLQRAVDALVLAGSDVIGRLSVEKADGTTVFDTPLARVLLDAGFRQSSRGLRLRA